jgi:alpha-beta hydrolase superfamily lysophospholipase
MIDVLDRSPRPAGSYAEACERFEASLLRDTPDVDPLSRSRLETPGQRATRAIVFLHGLTNSPQQFGMFSQRFLARGYSVLTPRLPYHGYVDRMTKDLAQLRAAQLIDVTAEAIDIACGLADEVTVCGLSLGGVLAIWAAQFRRIAVAAVIAPAIGLPILPLRATGFTFGALGKLPNRFIWWDPRSKEKIPGPPYAYPRWSTHALVQTQRLGLDLMDAARHSAPRADTTWVITNASDLAVNNAASVLLVKRWRGAGATRVKTFQFPRHMKLWHDVIDPLQPHAQPDLVHPMLEEIIADGRTPAVATPRPQVVTEET